MIELPVSFYATTGFVNFLTSVILAIFVISKSRRNPVNVAFFILATLIGLWSFSYYIWQMTDNYDGALFWARMLMVYTIMIPGAYLHFSCAFAGILKKRMWLVISGYLVFFFFLITNILPYFFKNPVLPVFIKRVAPVMNFKYWPMAEPVMEVWLSIFGLVVIYSSYTLIQKFRRSTGIEKLQAKYVSIGLITSFIGGTTNFIPWFLIQIPPVANIMVPAYVILIAYAITRYRLMDIKLVIKNILFYFGLSFFAYGVFYLLLWTYTYFFGSPFTLRAYLTGIFIAPVFAILMYNGSRFIFDFTDKYIFSSTYNYRQTISKMARDLSYYTGLNEIVSTIAKTTKENLQLDSVALLLGNGGENQKKFGIIETLGDMDRGAVSSTLDYDLVADYFKGGEKVLIKEELAAFAQETKDEGKKMKFLELKNQMEGLGISLCLSLSSKNKFLGIIAFGQKSESDPYNKKDIELLEALTFQAGIAIDNAMLYKKIEEKNENLQELLRVKNDFIRIVNHQLNTPFSIIRNTYYMLRDKELTLKKALNYLGNGVERLGQVMQDFWSVFQFENENIPLRPEKTDIAKMVRDMVEEKNKENLEIEKKRVKIYITDPDFEVPLVWCEPKKIVHVISNLIDNAVSYTPEGDVKISYEMEGDFLKISVKDTGIGISKEDQEKISMKFYRSRKAVSLHPDGSGLGVYIAKKITEENGGKLSFYSAGESKGTTFSITIPAFKGQK